MQFKITNDGTMILYKILSSEKVGTTLVNGRFALGTAEGTCELLPYCTVIIFNEVPEYELLILQKKSEEYTVYFAKDCKFPVIYDGHIIVENSIPLYQFLVGKTEENVVFAMKGTDYTDISL
ncbi:unnamed protein product [Hymenolepis diminuta]|uniref:Uncharacterized protein n=1 Tax=Hymenolepis diminuta TaxID=6216 RepID=A0A564Y1C0_HYMDI|nr:unnamed protein product [Hymenolepis diminuta]